MKAILEITNGEYRDRKLALRAPVQLTIGRTTLADYCVPYDLRMSSVHFDLEVEMSGITLRDRGSTNGTFVNDERVASVKLHEGDTIRAGTTTFSIFVEEAPKAGQSVTDGTLIEDSIVPSSDQTPAWEHAESRIPAGIYPREAAVDASSLASTPIHTTSEFPFESAFADPCVEVVNAALEAAAWLAHPGLLGYCRQQSLRLDVQAVPLMRMLAILGEAADIRIIEAIAQETSLGAARMAIVGKFGHPDLLPLLITNFQNADPDTAVAAGWAFQKIVGGDFDSDERFPLPQEDGRPAGELNADALLPDRDQADAFLRQHGSRLRQSPRWCRGFNVNQPFSAEWFSKLDLESRWETAMRSAYRRETQFRPQQLLQLFG